MTFDVKVSDRILKPIGEVFEAVADPAKMAHYFISDASGALAEGATVTWEFADVGAKVDIHVLSVRKNEKIVYESSALGRPIRTTIEFAADGPAAAIVTVTDSSFNLNEKDVKLALGQSAGWTYMLCGLKAYLQFGINIRTGLKKRLTDA